MLPQAVWLLATFHVSIAAPDATIALDAGKVTDRQRVPSDAATRHLNKRQQAQRTDDRMLLRREWSGADLSDAATGNEGENSTKEPEPVLDIDREKQQLVELDANKTQAVHGLDSVNAVHVSGKVQRHHVREFQKADLMPSVKQTDTLTPEFPSEVIYELVGQGNCGPLERRPSLLSTDDRTCEKMCSSDASCKGYDFDKGVCSLRPFDITGVAGSTSATCWKKSIAEAAKDAMDRIKKGTNVISDGIAEAGILGGNAGAEIDGNVMKVGHTSSSASWATAPVSNTASETASAQVSVKAVLEYKYLGKGSCRAGWIGTPSAEMETDDKPSDANLPRFCLNQCEGIPYCAFVAAYEDKKKNKKIVKCPMYDNRAGDCSNRNGADNTKKLHYAYQRTTKVAPPDCTYVYGCDLSAKKWDLYRGKDICMKQCTPVSTDLRSSDCNGQRLCNVAAKGCNDIPASTLISNQAACNSQAYSGFLIKKNCKNNKNWAKKKICQQSCFNNGVGYDGDDCSKTAPCSICTPLSTTGWLATQSSETKGKEAKKCIDGKFTSTGACTSKGSEADPWWQVDMKKEFRVATVKIWNRAHPKHCSGRLTCGSKACKPCEKTCVAPEAGVTCGVQVWVGSTSGSDFAKTGSQCGLLTDPAENIVSFEVTCNNVVSGQYVTLMFPGPKNTRQINMYEVEVFEAPAAYCKYEKDGVCDVPVKCPAGTDVVDCMAASTPAPAYVRLSDECGNPTDLGGNLEKNVDACKIECNANSECAGFDSGLDSEGAAYCYLKGNCDGSLGKGQGKGYRKVQQAQQGRESQQGTQPQQDCSNCIDQFAANGGCSLILAGHDANPLVPPGCNHCGSDTTTAILKYCRSTKVGSYCDEPRGDNLGYDCLCSSGTGFCDDSKPSNTWMGTYDLAKSKCDANDECTYLHDKSANGNNWRACRTVTSPGDGKAAIQKKCQAWPHIANVYCSSDWDYVAVKANSVDAEACKEQCKQDSRCVGVSVTNAKYHNLYPDETPWCGICTSTTPISEHVKFDTFWKPSAHQPCGDGQILTKNAEWCDCGEGANDCRQTDQQACETKGSKGGWNSVPCDVLMTAGGDVARYFGRTCCSNMADDTPTCVEGTTNVYQPSPGSGKCYCGTPWDSPENKDGYCSPDPQFSGFSSHQCKRDADDPDGICGYYCMCDAAIQNGGPISCCRPNFTQALINNTVTTKADPCGDNGPVLTINAEWCDCGEGSQECHQSGKQACELQGDRGMWHSEPCPKVMSFGPAFAPYFAHKCCSIKADVCEGNGPLLPFDVTWCSCGENKQDCRQTSQQDCEQLGDTGIWNVRACSEIMYYPGMAKFFAGVCCAAQAQSCLRCADQFAESGGCNRLNTGVGIETQIPTGCEPCAMEAAKHCHELQQQPQAAAQPANSSIWQQIEGRYCSENWDYQAAQSNTKDVEACKAQCQADASCVGVSVTNEYYHNTHTDSPWCGLCISLTTMPHANFDTWVQPLTPSPTAPTSAPSADPTQSPTETPSDTPEPPTEGTREPTTPTPSPTSRPTDPPTASPAPTRTPTLAPPTPAPQKPTTTVTQPVAAGATRLPVASTEGFQIGDELKISGGGKSETNYIQGFGGTDLLQLHSQRRTATEKSVPPEALYLILKNPTQNTYPAGTTTEAEPEEFETCNTCTDVYQKGTLTAADPAVELVTKPVDKWEDCQTLCTQFPGCTAWLFSNEMGNCFLHGGEATVAADENGNDVTGSCTPQVGVGGWQQGFDLSTDEGRKAAAEAAEADSNEVCSDRVSKLLCSSAVLTSALQMPAVPSVSSTFTLEAWIKSPLTGTDPREIFGGITHGFLLLYSREDVACEGGWGMGFGRKTKYSLHIGNSGASCNICLRADTWYHVAAAKDAANRLQYFTNGQLCADTTWTGAPALSDSVGAGFVDSGGLSNLRIWKSAISRTDIIKYAWMTKLSPDLKANLLHHWWPLTQHTLDLITNKELIGSAAYKTSTCTLFALSGMPKLEETTAPTPTPVVPNKTENKTQSFAMRSNGPLQFAMSFGLSVIACLIFRS